MNEDYDPKEAAHALLAERLRRVVQEELRPLRDDLQEIGESVEKLRLSYFGNGEPGLKTRVDRLEVRDKWRSVMEKAVVSGALAVITPRYCEVGLHKRFAIAIAISS
jgi:hypothetical protein